MIQQIISHTPVFVWALLALLIYRGVLATRDREVKMAKLFIIPVVMVVASLAGIGRHGVLGDGVWAVWLTAMLASAALTVALGRGEVVVNRAAGTVLQRGSWVPMLMMIAIFVTKYTVAAYSAMHPEVLHQTMFALSVTTLYGLFNGVFVGRLLRNLSAYLRQPVAVMA